MKAVDVRWFPDVNRLVVKCVCKRFFEQRLDRWTARCPLCGASESIVKLRNELAGILTFINK